MYKLNCFARNFSLTHSRQVFQHGGEVPSKAPKPPEGKKETPPPEESGEGAVNAAARRLDTFNTNNKEADKTITNEKQGELFGLMVFPNNPRGQELRKKEHLGLLTPEEQKELNRLYQLKHRQETMTPELQEIWEKTEANDPNVMQVSMNQGGLVEVSPDDKQEKIIWTYGLGGCFGTLVFSEDKNGRKTAVLTHFDPLSISQNMSELRRLIRSNPAMKTSQYKQTILVLGIEEYEQDPETGQWEKKIRYPQEVDMLITAIKAELGPDVEVKLEPYSKQKDVTTKDHGSLIVRIPPKGQATYRTWFSKGQLGRTDEN